MLMQNPYLRLMRLHQPVGIWLLFWPCAWSLLLHGGWQLLPLFLLGAVVMRSAGCIVNDLWDREIDARVERTKTRPLASGEVSTRGALLLLTVLLAIALAIALYLGVTVALWAALSLPLIIIYPVMKRITWWPQAFLGLTFNWGALLGSVAATGEVTPAALLLYIAGFFWTLGYDTVYAFQDIADDAKIGVKSSARAVSTRPKMFLAAAYTVSTLCLVLAGITAHAAPTYYLALLSAAAYFAWQVNLVQPQNPALCLKLFKSNTWIGGIIALAALLH